MAGLTRVAPLLHGSAPVESMCGSQNCELIAVKSAEDHQHLRNWSSGHADSCDLAKTGPFELEVVPGQRAARKASRFASVTSTCSTGLTDGLSEPEDLGSDDEHPLAGQVWLLSQDPIGCRRVQEALEAAPSDEAREILVAELHGHVAKAMRCPHANHVLQKCIALLRPETLQFIVDEINARDGLAVQAAKHRYACRIVQKLLNKCPASQTAALVEALLRDTEVLACHTIGHYTVQQVLELGTEDQRYRLIRAVERNMSRIGPSSAGGAVVCAALTYAAAEDKIWIARAVLQDAEVLLSLATRREGSSAALLVLQTLQDREQERACEVLLEHLGKLRSSKHGRVVAEHLLSCGISPSA